MRQLAASILIILFISACSSKNKIPKDILPKQKMEDVMWDILKAGEFLEVYVIPRDTTTYRSPKIQAWYDHVFKLHKVTRDQFARSYTWYQNHPVIMKELLDSLSNKPVQGFRPPTQGLDSTAYKDSLKRASDSSQKKPLVLPGGHRPGFFNTDSIRKARAKQLKVS